MTAWRDVERAAPEFARRVQELFEGKGVIPAGQRLPPARRASWPPVDRETTTPRQSPAARKASAASPSRWLASSALRAAAFRTTSSVYPTLMMSSDSLDIDVLTLAG